MSLFDCINKKKVINYHSTGRYNYSNLIGKVSVLDAELECGHHQDFPTTGVLFECLECEK